MEKLISTLKEKLGSIEVPQIVVLVLGIIAVLIALNVAKTVLKVVLLIVAALAFLYFFYPSLYETVLGAIF